MTRNIAIFVATLLLAASSALADEVRVGDSRDRVLQVMGNPSGSIVHGAEETLFYPRGRINLRDGEVVDSNIISDWEFRRRQQAAQVDAEEMPDDPDEKDLPPPAVAEGQVEEADDSTAVEDAEAAERREAEIQRAIAEGIRQPPHDMSSRRLRRFRRGRSETLLALREEQIREEFEQLEE